MNCLRGRVLTQQATSRSTGMVYHATYAGDYLAALDLETGREFTYRELDSAVFLSEKLDGALERRQSSSS